MRIASLSPAVTEILFAIGAEKQIVCTDQFSDYPDGVKAIPHLKNHQKIEYEAVKEFQPDIVFTSTLVQQKLAEELRSHEQFAVVHQDPRSLNEVYESIRMIGTLLECEERARSVAEQLRSGFNLVKKRSGVLFKKPRVYIEEWHNPPMVSGNWVPDIVRLAGGIPFPLKPGEESRKVLLPEVEQFNPDLIVLSICGAGNLAEKKLLTERAGWNLLPAVKANRVFVIDDSFLNRPGPRLVEGAQRLYGWIFQAAHM